MSTKQTSLLNFGFILKTHKTWLKRTILVHYFQLNLLLHKLPFQVAAYLGSLYPDHFKMNSHQDPFAFQCSESFCRAQVPRSDADNFCCREHSEQVRASILHLDAWGEKLQIYQTGCSPRLLALTS